MLTYRNVQNLQKQPVGSWSFDLNGINFVRTSKRSSVDLERAVPLLGLSIFWAYIL